MTTPTPNRGSARRFTWEEGDIEIISGPTGSNETESNAAGGDASSDRTDRVRTLRERVTKVSSGES